MSHERLSQLLMPNQVEAWLFQIGFSLGELRCTLILLNLCLDFKINLGLTVLQDIEKVEKRLTDLQTPLKAASEQLDRYPLGMPFVNLHKLLSPILVQLTRLMQNEAATAGQIIAVAAPLIRRLSLIEREEVATLPSAVT